MQSLQNCRIVYHFCNNMKAQLLKIHPESPEMRKISRVIEVLRNGGIIIYPTDTVYGIGCDLMNKKAIQRLLQIKGIKAKHLNLSFICNDLSQIASFTRPISNPVFKIMRKCLPGPFTFLLESNHKVPKILDQSKKTVGVRVPDNKIPLAIVNELGNPLISASIKDDDEIVEYISDPAIIYQNYGNLVDVIVDGGFSNIIPSTVVDCSKGDIEVIREGAGDLDLLY